MRDMHEGRDTYRHWTVLVGDGEAARHEILVRIALKINNEVTTRGKIRNKKK